MQKLTLYKVPWSGDPSEERNQFLGGSDTGTILGINPFKSPYTLWLEKTGRVEPTDLSDKLAVKVGHMVEDTVAKLYEQETGHRVRESLVSYMCKEYPFLKGHVDRLVIDDSTRGLECKTTSSNNHYDYENGDVPPYYYSQCQFYMMMTGKKYWDLATLKDNTHFYVNTIERDDDYIDALLESMKNFWNCVTTNSPPMLDNSKSTTESINHQFHESSHNEKAVDISSLDALLENRCKYAELEQQYKALKTQLDNQIKVKLEDNEIGKSKKFIVTWKPSKPKFNPSKAKTFLTDDEYQQCLDNSSRILRVKALKQENE
jgi:putative phage-type endonuclease